jgi:hypothetical protein
MINPTVGRKVWYRPSANDKNMAFVAGEPLDATIVAVHNDNCVNLVIFDYNGVQHTRCSAYLAQEGTPVPAWAPAYAEWMPYQVGQAKAVKTKTYADGTTATGTGPLPDASPTSGHVELDNIGNDKNNW